MVLILVSLTTFVIAAEGFMLAYSRRSIDTKITYKQAENISVRVVRLFLFCLRCSHSIWYITHDGDLTWSDEPNIKLEQESVGRERQSLLPVPQPTYYGLQTIITIGFVVFIVQLNLVPSWILMKSDQIFNKVAWKGFYYATTLPSNPINHVKFLCFQLPTITICNRNLWLRDALKAATEEYGTDILSTAVHDIFVTRNPPYYRGRYEFSLYPDDSE